MRNADDVPALAQLVLRERQARDRGWWRQMREAFSSDSTVRLSWYSGDGPGFVTASERMSARGDSAVHRLSPPVVHVHADRAIAEVPCGIEFQVEVEDVPAVLISRTRLNYKMRRLSGQWLIVALDAVYERDSLTPSFPGSRLTLDSEATKGHRRSYALLTYYLRGRGYDIDDDLLGDDRPEEVARFYNHTHLWLNAQPSA